MILVSGGTGMLGAHVLWELVSNEQKVRALIRPNSSTDLCRKIFSYYTDDPDFYLNQIHWVKGDVLDIVSLEKAMNKVKHVYHCAAMVSFQPNDRDELMRVNVEGTANMVNVALHRGVRKFCHVSSIASLGRADNGGLTTEMHEWDPSEPHSNYSLSKYKAELEVWRAYSEGLPCVIVNPSVIIGPGDWNKGSAQLIKTVWDGLKYYTHGMNGYVDVRDVAASMIELTTSKITGERFVISAQDVSYHDLFYEIAEHLKVDPPAKLASKRLSEMVWRLDKVRSFITRKAPIITRETARTANSSYRYSSHKMVSALNFKFMPIVQSIKDNCNWFLQEKKN